MNNELLYIQLHHWEQKMRKISFAIIGGGPAAFYTSKLLSKLPCQPTVDIYERELCPFGLIRYGVAPDHISIKKSQITLSQAANYPQFRYFGNVEVNHELLQQIRSKYSGVVYAYGASKNAVPSWMQTEVAQSNPKIKYARELVYWYNGHPSKQHSRQNLDKVRNVTIIGNGNVAIDVCRILLRKPSELESTEISRNALEQLKNCNVENVQIFARRGVTHSAFAIKEIRELDKCGLKMYAVQEELEASITPASYIECTSIGDHFSSVVRMNKRKLDFIQENFMLVKEAEVEKLKALPGKKIIFRYLSNPVSVQDNSITFEKTKLTGQAFKQKSQPTGVQYSTGFDLLVISTGFEISSLEGVHFDQQKKRVHNSDGCVVSSEGKVSIGDYAVGWCKNGPRGVIDETLLSCEETYNNIRIHLKNNLLEPKEEPAPPQKYISFNKYSEVREIELTRGIRDKFVKSKMTSSELRSFYGLG